MTRMLPTPVHIHPVYASCGQSPYVATFSRVVNRVGHSHCSREKGLPTQSTTHRLTDPRIRTQFLSWTSQWSSGKSHTSINSRLLGLPGAYHWHAIGTFNTCSQGPTHRSLTDTGGGYNLEGVSFPRTHSPTFSTSCLPFPIVAPGLYFNQVLTTKPKCWVLENLWPSRDIFTTRPSIVAYIYA
jgi:hypothetical protein